MSSDERIEVRRPIAADPATIFAILRDPKGHVAIDSTGMLMDATGEPVTAVDDTFEVHMDREALERLPARALRRHRAHRHRSSRTGRSPGIDRGASSTSATSTATGSSRSTSGTLVTQYYDWSGIDQQWKDAGIFPVISERALRATLGILARARRSPA